ncbi:YwiC-like family protein [Salipaludibacillus sp. LMS25]|uniref:YwiC-like family protein n=1 Tax=Salipaludibacillus sp. LMS25 TaxID=2924031 RepID=UPI0020D1AC24|nr:YwiC-like family protein [Salipaludibacillus sp. LMS25]UTR15374.1 YwiC-like family protein [Salipaludibacillus sp. LMS25]
MKWYVPKEHGAWAMFIIPFWTGASISGLSWHHLIFFTGLTGLYFAQAPLLTYIRQPKHQDVWPSFLIYAGIGLVITGPYIVREMYLVYIFLSIFPLFLVNSLFAKLKKERLFINDLSAIVALSALLLSAYVIGIGELRAEAFQYMVLIIIFFVASVFHVKALIREKKNKTFKLVSLVYHVTVTVLAFLTGWLAVGGAFLLTLVKTTLIPKKYLRKPMHIGIVEIVNSVVFYGLLVSGYYIFT